MSKKMKICKTCGTEIAASAKTCPCCGAKNKKGHPILIAVVVVLVLFAAIGSSGSDTTTTSAPAPSSTPEVIEYQAYSVHDMVDILEKNAMKAEATFDGQYVEISGRINVIDSDGKYISVVSAKDKYAFTGVTCYIMNDEQTNAVMEMSVNDKIVIRGKITGVGEVLGYYLDITEIVS